MVGFARMSAKGSTEPFVSDGNDSKGFRSGNGRLLVTSSRIADRPLSAPT